MLGLLQWFLSGNTYSADDIIVGKGRHTDHESQEYGMGNGRHDKRLWLNLFKGDGGREKRRASQKDAVLRNKGGIEASSLRLIDWRRGKDVLI